MKVGYSYWGFLADVKLNNEYKEMSTPDGNAFYSWSIIKELQKRGHQVVQIMPDRDLYSYQKHGISAFSAWAGQDRMGAYQDMEKVYNIGLYNFYNMSYEMLESIWNQYEVYKCDVILHEWRMVIPGRNDSSAEEENWQPDLFIQRSLIRYCEDKAIRLVIFDLDYKLEDWRIKQLKEANRKLEVFELGDKWENIACASHVEIPFDFSHIYDFELDLVNDIQPTNLIYVGNRYERDWCIDKYIPTELSRTVVYGNWLESGRDSRDKWPNITFGKRLQTSEMREVYGSSLATVLLAKRIYCTYHFMTARIIESVFYGTVPLFIEEFGEETIKKYAGIYYKDLTVHSKSDIIDIVQYMRYNRSYRKNVIDYLRHHLSTFMDVKFFVDKLLEEK